MKFIDEIIERDGVPKALKVDNATAFKPAEFDRYSANLNVKVHFSTPHVHTSIGLVERNIQTVENYVKTYIIEKRYLKEAVRRAIRTLRFSWSASTKQTPFELFHGRKPRSVLTNVVNLDNEGKDLIENILEKSGKQLTQIHYSAKTLKGLKSERKFGKSAETEDLRKELRRRKVREPRYFVVRNRNERALVSRFETKVRKLVSETDHTVSDGKKTFHKKDIAEVPYSVANNQVNLQAKEIASRVDNRMKDIKRGRGGRFANANQPGRSEKVKAKGGRKVDLDTSDTDDQALAKVGRRQKKLNRRAFSSATRTGTTPPGYPSKNQIEQAEPQSPMETSTAQDSLVTAPASPYQSQPKTPPQPESELPETAVQDNETANGTTVHEIIQQLDREPVRASNYGKTVTFNSLTELRPQGAKKAPLRFGCGLTY